MPGRDRGAADPSRHQRKRWYLGLRYVPRTHTYHDAHRTPADDAPADTTDVADAQDAPADAQDGAVDGLADVPDAVMPTSASLANPEGALPKRKARKRGSAVRGTTGVPLPVQEPSSIAHGRPRRDQTGNWRDARKP